MKPKSVKFAAILLTCVATLIPRAALAQLTVGPNTNVINLGVIFIGNDIAYDPDHNIYLSVAAYGAVYGVFVSTSGAAASSPFRIGSAGPASYGHYPRTIYSRDLNGGGGGFLVTWHQGDGYLHSVVVASPSGAMSTERLISDGGQSGTRAGGNTGLAFSPTSHRFLVTWTTGAFGIQGRFLDSSGAPSGAVTQYVSAGGAQEPQLAWNPATDDFGLIHGAFNSVVSWIGFMRIPASGASAAAPTAFGYGAGTFSPSISVNTSTNHYIVGWSVGGGAYGTEIDQNGFKVAGERFLASRLGTPTSFELAYNPASDTFLAVSEDPRSIEVAGIELTSNGSPISVAVGLSSGASSGSFVPRLAARTNSKEWSISYARNMNALANQLISTGGAAPPPPPPSTTPPPPPPPPPTTTKKNPADFDGDSKADAAIYRAGAGQFLVRRSSDPNIVDTIALGDSDSQAVKGDYDGDGKPDIGVWKPSNGQWVILRSSFSYSLAGAIIRNWGDPSFQAVPADYDGDGKTDIAVYRPSTGIWWILTASSNFNNYYTVGWGGGPDFKPVPADYDGDGKANVAVWNTATGYWWIMKSSPSDYFVVGWGDPTFRDVPGDYDGDGKADIAVWRPSTGYWWILTSSSNFKSYVTRGWGDPTFLAVPADYDGDGKTDIVVWRPGTTVWWVLTSSSGFNSYTTFTWGLAGDVPLGGIMP